MYISRRKNLLQQSQIQFVLDEQKIICHLEVFQLIAKS